MMGADGFTEATSVAVLSANYVAKRLESAFPVLYAGDHDLVAHECILDVRPSVKEPPASASTTSPSGSSTTASTLRR